MKQFFEQSGLKAWDEYTISNTPIKSIDLMEKAGIACCKRILGTIQFQSASVFCGIGNNGGDGLVIARVLHERNINTSVYIIGDPTKGSADFNTNLKRLPKAITPIILTASINLNCSTDICIDAIFGNGLSRPVTGWIGDIIEQINKSNATLFAIDLPSGIFADFNDKNPLKKCIEADFTLSIQSLKWPMIFAEYERYFGRIFHIEIDLLPTFTHEAIAEIIDAPMREKSPQSIFTHKGKKGFLTVIGGFNFQAGAAILAAKAGFRSGCGYVGVISDTATFVPLITNMPEVIYSGNQFSDLNAKTKAIAIGPGIGTDEKAIDLLSQALKSGLPLVIDADGINILGQNLHWLKDIDQPIILTPHLKELERLIGTYHSPEQRIQAQLDFSKKYGVYIVQKGAFSKLTSPEGKIYINTTGNASMATAGMGDALTGIIGSFLAQGNSAEMSAINGMYYHGLAGDIAVRNIGSKGLITSDLISHLPKAFNSI